MMMQKQQQQGAKGAGGSQMGASSLPPIIPLGSQNLSMNAQNNKYGEPKLSGRSNAPSVNHNSSMNAQTKKRKKYRMNHVQQQRVAQNSESVMRAYGVPKYFGASGGEGELLILAICHMLLGSKVSCLCGFYLGASSNVAGMAPMVGQYQVRNYAQGNKKL
ncbi:hypothetical protein EON64_06380 [archaeon]|nr:MAG: hypothetical protein EON64_06380 [archaeon]